MNRRQTPSKRPLTQSGVKKSFKKSSNPSTPTQYKVIGNNLTVEVTQGDIDAATTFSNSIQPSNNSLDLLQGHDFA